MTINVKDIIIKPVSAATAWGGVKQWHYSGKKVNNSSLHLGAFYNGVFCGVMSFGPSMDKSKTIGLVAGTKWNDFLELNRMAFSDVLPKNAESRCLAVAFRLIKKHYPNIRWIISFADGTQCGDGTIYRASGFILTQIKANNQIMRSPDDKYTVTQMSLSQPGLKITQDIAQEYGITLEGASLRPFLRAGFKFIDGYMFRYIKFLDPDAQKNLTVPIIPFSKIKELHASMYKGQKLD